MTFRKEKEEKLPGAVIPADVEEYEQILVKYRGRTVDVTASLNHVFNKYLEEGEKELDKKWFKDVCRDLELELSDKEVKVALRAFKKEKISFRQFFHWWVD